MKVSFVLGHLSLVLRWLLGRERRPVAVKMAGTSFENLQVYRLSEQLADEVWKLVSGWDYFSKVAVGRQIVRAVDSIGANIAEGTGAGTTRLTFSVTAAAAWPVATNSAA